MNFEQRIALEESIRKDFKKLSKKSEETIRKEAKKHQQKELKYTFKHDDKYYIDKVFNPTEFPKNFDIEFDLVRAKSHSPSKYQELNDLWNWYKSRVSSLKTGLPPGRALRILVKEKTTQKYIGMISLSDVSTGIKDRDNYIGWSKDTKFSRDKNGKKIIDYVMDISTCVPLQPFGFNFNGGKLLAMLCFSKEIQDMCLDIYGHNIAMFQTMGVNGKSPMYSRCNLEKGGTPYLKYVGMTVGHGVTSLIPEDLYSKCIDYLKLIDSELFKGISPYRSKLLKIRTCMGYVNISTDFLDTKSKKGIYCGFTSDNSQPFLKGETETFTLGNAKSSSEICAGWLSRWAYGRYNSRLKFKTLRYNDQSLVSHKRNEETKRKTDQQRKRRELLRNEECQEERKRKIRKQNNRTNIRKYLNSMDNVNSETIELIITKIPSSDLESKTTKMLVTEILETYDLSKTKKLIKDDYTLKPGWGTIYVISNNINGKKYIGQAMHFRSMNEPFGFNGRMKEHLKASRSNTKSGCPALSAAISKYGWKNFTKYPLLECLIEYLDEFEIKFIAEYETHVSTGKGYNIAQGGSCRPGNYNYGMQHHMWGKSLTEDHKDRISKSNIVSKRSINDDILNIILNLKHSNYTQNEIIKMLKEKYDVNVHGGVIERIWNGEMEPLNKTKRILNHDEIVMKKRKQVSTKRTDDEIVEEIFSFKFNNFSAEDTVKYMKEKYTDMKIAAPLVNKVWCKQLVPRFPSKEYDELSSINRTMKKRKLEDSSIENVYFLKFKNIRQEQAVKKMKEEYDLNVTQQDVSYIWRQKMKPMNPSSEYKAQIEKDIINPPKRILTDEQKQEVLSLKGQLSAAKAVDYVKNKYDITVKRSYVNDIWRPKRKK